MKEKCVREIWKASAKEIKIQSLRQEYKRQSWLEMAGWYRMENIEFCFSHVKFKVSLEYLSKMFSRLLAGMGLKGEIEPNQTFKTLVTVSELAHWYGLDDLGNGSMITEDGQERQYLKQGGQMPGAFECHFPLCLQYRHG